MAREEFPAFPFPPYAIQLQLMRSVYAALDKGGVAIVESPTGTGKTLSLICSVLQWVQDRKECSSKQDGDGGGGDQEDEPEWMRDFSSSKPVEGMKEKVAKKKNNNCVGFFGSSSPRKKDGSRPPPPPPASTEDDEEFLLEDYADSDGGGSASIAKRKQGLGSDSSSDSDDDDEDDGEGEEMAGSKIFFCSRTHSQLSQFVGELKRTKFSSSMQAISLGSRKTLCVNQDVIKLGSASRINDRCLELQKSKKSSSQKVDGKRRIKSKASSCPYLRKHRLRKQFKEEALTSEPMDIEDLVRLGQKLGTCPYYGSRSLLPMARVVVLPYQSLLHAATRESLGIDVKDAVVIFDEAHNLEDTVANTYSAQLSSIQLGQVSSQLSQYFSRFRSRLAPANRRYIQTLIVLAEALLKRLQLQVESRCREEDLQAPATREITTINDFVFSLGIDNINLFKLCRYIKDSNIVNKISGYGEKYLLQQADLLKDRGSSTAGFHALASFLQSLTTAQSDGRVLLVENPDREFTYKFLMLDAAKHFSEIVQQARTVILAGGTLQPVAELRDRLLFEVPEERLHFFSCGHIVPGESILPLSLSKGPSGKTFDFTYQSRSSPEMIDELGRLLVNISAIVPEGVVVFFPSFEYESQVYKSWDKSGILASILKKKKIFREPRNASAVETVLQEYKLIVPAGGALLLSVVGGKMSEGINFSDGMGRCVVMVGLPYPNLKDPELLEKIKYVDELNITNKQSSSSSEQKRAAFTLQQCGNKGRDYYENLCMKAVNQSIGRAIRHAKDYAAILLLDGRYAAAGGPAAKLPAWIREHLVVVNGGFGEAHRLLHRFFKKTRP